MDSSEKDRLFAVPCESISPFEFGEHTARVFDDMLARSVPYYAEIQRMVAELGDQFIVDGTCVYDLGCSTGNTMALLGPAAQRLPDVTLVGVDNSAAMLERARAKLESAGLGGRFRLVEQDLADVEVRNASVVLLVLTLQFVDHRIRADVLKRIHEAILPGGALIVVEKVTCEDECMDALFVDRYYAYKRSQGYTDLEIDQKRRALENVLVPFNERTNINLLREAGFHAVEPFFRWYNFECFLALKGEGC
jgi:tRNA (cmo5U34)-methyltransferase